MSAKRKMKERWLREKTEEGGGRGAAAATPRHVKNVHSDANSLKPRGGGVAASDWAQNRGGGAESDAHCIHGRFYWRLSSALTKVKKRCFWEMSEGGGGGVPAQATPRPVKNLYSDANSLKPRGGGVVASGWAQNRGRVAYTETGRAYS